MNLYSDETKIMIDNIKEKYKSKIIGFTCSCFDLLHAGHIIMLEDSKNHCDVLIVGLQTDPTIDRKEKNKPINWFFYCLLYFCFCDILFICLDYSPLSR